VVTAFQVCIKFGDKAAVVGEVGFCRQNGRIFPTMVPVNQLGGCADVGVMYRYRCSSFW
jgi:hypothetical protein